MGLSKKTVNVARCPFHMFPELTIEHCTKTPLVLVAVPVSRNLRSCQSDLGILQRFWWDFEGTNTDADREKRAIVVSALSLA